MLVIIVIVIVVFVLPRRSGKVLSANMSADSDAGTPQEGMELQGARGAHPPPRRNFVNSIYASSTEGETVGSVSIVAPQRNARQRTFFSTIQLQADEPSNRPKQQQAPAAKKKLLDNPDDLHGESTDDADIIARPKKSLTLTPHYAEVDDGSSES